MKTLWIALLVVPCVAVALGKHAKDDTERRMLNNGKPEEKTGVEPNAPPKIDDPRGRVRRAGRSRKRKLSRILRKPKVEYDGKRDEACGYGKAGGCEDQDGCDWSNYPNSIMCTGKDARRAIRFGFSCDTRDLILHLHDAFRKNSTTNSASNEQKLYWDDCLAQQAQKRAQSCVYNHDTRAQRVYPNAGPTPGQNLGWGTSWESVIRTWVAEKQSFTFGANNLDSAVGHYTQLMKGGTNRIGCGYAYCKNKMLEGYYVCNYGNGQFPSDLKTPWQQGAPCEACTAETCVDGLCDCGGKMCHHGGRLNMRTCTCDCIAAFDSDSECKTMNLEWRDAKCAKAEPTICGTAPYTKENCCKYSNLYAVCPHTCGICDADTNMGDPVGCQSTI